MPAPDSPGFRAIAFSPSVMRRAVRVASVVGCVLAAINHGDRFVDGTLDLPALARIALTFVVPYCVSTYSSVLAVREGLQVSSRNTARDSAGGVDNS